MKSGVTSPTGFGSVKTHSHHVDSDDEHFIVEMLRPRRQVSRSKVLDDKKPCAADSKVLGTVTLGSGPESTIADGKGNVFVNLEDKSELLRIDSKSLQVKDRWPVTPCQAPSSLAFDEVNSRLFLGCRSRVMAIVDRQNGKVIGTYPVGDKVDASAFDPATKIVFSSTGDGDIYRFHQDSPDTYSALELISTAPGSKTMNIDKKTQRVFVPAREDGKVALWVLQP